MLTALPYYQSGDLPVFLASFVIFRNCKHSVIHEENKRNECLFLLIYIIESVSQLKCFLSVFTCNVL